MPTILIGSGRTMKRVDSGGWLQELQGAREKSTSRLAFMTDQHRLVRKFVVSEVLRRGRPIPPAAIARRLKIDASTVRGLLADLEQNLFFLVRNKKGHVTWAYPVTCEKTQHRLRFSSGEAIYAA